MSQVPQPVGEGQAQARAPASAREGSPGVAAQMGVSLAAKAFALTLLERKSGLASEGERHSVTTEVISDHPHLPFPS